MNAEKTIVAGATVVVGELAAADGVIAAEVTAGVSPAHTSVPRWTARTVSQLPIDPTASTYVVVIASAEAQTAAAEFVRNLPGVPAIVVDARAGTAALNGVLAAARVGWRFAVIGAQPGLSRCRGAILAAGALDAEIVTAAVESDAALDVFCSHCRAVTTSPAAVGAEIRCDGCGHPLVVYHHYSRRLRAYLGYRPDAEDLP